MPLNQSLKKVLIIGSGPIVIGQAAEFDYSGTQACHAIREEGIETILVNSNPATIMTDAETADKVYIEPLTKDSLIRIIEKEKPCGILAGFGGQTALNLAMTLESEGHLKRLNTKLLGMRPDTIHKAEDRDAFRALMQEISEPIPESVIATDYETCERFLRKVGLPLIIRPAYTLGGTGGGIAKDEKTFELLCKSGLANSPIGQILIERSIAGWKEIEYEVMRDGFGNAMIVCNMENIDPVGVHTGDSIVVAPSQTLPDYAYQMLRDSSLKIIEALEIEGGCNVQFGLHPNHKDYIVIEVNPRVSRSSALASKAAGYPIAKIAAKIAIGYGLHELKNYATQNTSACFEPALDYIVVKFPKWPFDKFRTASKRLSTQMKATGEVMAIDRTFSGAMIKAVTSLDGGIHGLRQEKYAPLSDEEIKSRIQQCDDERIFVIYEGIRRGIRVDWIHEATQIDMWFLKQLKAMVQIEIALERFPDEQHIKKAIEAGFTENEVLKLSKMTLEDFKKIQVPKRVYKIVDTCSAEFAANTPYFYSCYESEDEGRYEAKKKVVVIGSGPIRIGQGIEFDYSCVHAVKALRKKGIEAIMINNNPETVSTDFDTADKLYFESLHFDYVKALLEKEQPDGVVVQFGGQTAINLADQIEKAGFTILGTAYNAIDLTEDRDRFRMFLEQEAIPSPKGDVATCKNEALVIAERLGYPLVIRPSYVIGGSSMTILYDEASLNVYYEQMPQDSVLLIDQYLKGTEIEVDAISDGESILIPGIMEHIEKTGVHSGDSICVYPTRTLGAKATEKILETTKRIARGIQAKGLINIQYVWYKEELYVIEVNPRASRTVPILSKITDTPMVDIAMEIMLGKTLNDLTYGTGLKENKKYHAVKIPVFSTEKMGDADMFLSPEMKSTGEVLGLDFVYENAVLKAFKAAGYKMPLEGGVLFSLKDEDKTLETVQMARTYIKRGFTIYATKETHLFLKSYHVECRAINKDTEVIQKIMDDTLVAVVNTPTRGLDKNRFGYTLRNKMIQLKKPLFTSIETSLLYLEALEVLEKNSEITPYTIQSLTDAEF